MGLICKLLGHNFVQAFNDVRAIGDNWLSGRQLLHCLRCHANVGIYHDLSLKKGRENGIEPEQAGSLKE